MDIKISGPRLAAIATVGLVFGVMISSDNASSKLAHYKELNYDQLIAELASKGQSPALFNLLGGIVFVAILVLVVDALDHGYTRLWANVGPDVTKAFKQLLETRRP